MWIEPNVVTLSKNIRVRTGIVSCFDSFIPLTGLNVPDYENYLATTDL